MQHVYLYLFPIVETEISSEQPRFKVVKGHLFVYHVDWTFVCELGFQIMCTAGHMFVMKSEMGEKGAG